ncbi:hypothetical protein GCM10010497_45720 [Streptomyces cinereoruber]|uniref:Uncharacterized protein n=1 Tax=Streptomyces cinereoruber TaxID=67260 RepID=A0AAV4KSI1_9ACTN|nr:hypothetical protein GCM10010497_45720 [Streptomyces cinereoruber]
MHGPAARAAPRRDSNQRQPLQETLPGRAVTLENVHLCVPDLRKRALALSQYFPAQCVLRTVVMPGSSRVVRPGRTPFGLPTGRSPAAAGGVALEGLSKRSGRR